LSVMGFPFRLGFGLQLLLQPLPRGERRVARRQRLRGDPKRNAVCARLPARNGVYRFGRKAAGAARGRRP
jgi:hypothetical protein